MSEGPVSRITPRRKGVQSKESLHPAAPFVALFVAVAVGRLPEVIPALHSLQLGKLTLVAAIAAVMFSRAESNEVLKSPLGVRVALFAGLSVLSLTYSIWGSRTLIFLELDMLRIFLIFVLIYKTSINTKTIQFYVYVVAAVLALMVSVGLAAQAGRRMSFSNTYDPNDIGLVVLTASAFLYGTANAKGVAYRIPLVVLSVVGFAVVLSTGSRGAFLGLCVVGLYFLTANVNPGRGRLYRMPNPKVILGVFIVIIVLMLLTPQESWNRILTIFELESDYNTSGDRGRLAIWERGIGVFFQQPWGVGGGAYQAADLRAGGTFITAHNSLLQVAVELGLIGFILYVSFFRKTWKYTESLIRGRCDVEGATVLARGFGIGARAALIGYLISGFFLSMAYGRIFYVILALVAAVETVWLSGRTSGRVPIRTDGPDATQAGSTTQSSRLSISRGRLQ